MKETSIVPSLLLVAFIVLKLCGVIAWSWWWVMAPLWIPAAVAVCVLAGFIRIKKVEKGDEPASASKWQQRLNEMEQRKTQFKDR